MIETRFSTYLKPLLLVAAAVLPTQSLAAYTCSNPAICIAVCGSKTCGAIKDDDADMTRLDSKPMALSSGVTASSSNNQSRARPYTCWNPAICIAVCGKKTCG